MLRGMRLIALVCACAPLVAVAELPSLLLEWDPQAEELTLRHHEEPERVVLKQVAKEHFRPYFHPIHSRDGRGVVTEFSPAHHKHQTGLYWGLTRVNGRDYFHHPGEGYWRREAVQIRDDAGQEVAWTVAYHLIDERGDPILLQEQRWSFRQEEEHYVLDLDWSAKALTDVTVGEFKYGGLFLRAPWRKGVDARILTSEGVVDEAGEGQPARWVDLELEVAGMDEPAHVTMLDHPSNRADGPMKWRIDGQFGFGPAPSRDGDWTIPAGERAGFLHRILIHEGPLASERIEREYRAFAKQEPLEVVEPEAADSAPAEAAARMTVPEGLEVKAFAGEPLIEQPMAFCWDHRGRLWIAENRDYVTRGGHATGSGSRILILEDTDQDGIADERKVFLDGIDFPSGIAWGMGGLWVGAPPHLYFVPDADRDDVADREDLEIHLTGWGIQDRHETLNSFIWGPDGWLYGCHGIFTRSNVGVVAPGTGVDPTKPLPAKPLPVVGAQQYIDGGIWRYHPQRREFEVVAHGTSNPWGVDFDDHGECFITACVISHLWHILPGGYYVRQAGSHRNPHVYHPIDTIADHTHTTAFGGARFYLADAFPEKWRGQLFTANMHTHSVLTDIFEPVGSGFVGKHGGEPLIANDDHWVGFSTEVGPEGAVYVLDWHDADVCGHRVVHKETGRVFRLAPKGLSGVEVGDLEAKSDAELVALIDHPNDWFTRHARTILQHRAALGELEEGTRETLWQRFRGDESVPKRLRALWALHVTGGIATEELLPLLEDPEPYVRMWAIRFLTERTPEDATVFEALARLAATAESPVVRRELAVALQRIPVAERWAIAAPLAARADDAEDPNIPKMLWFGVEPLVEARPARALELATGSKIPYLSECLARRAALAGEFEALLVAIDDAFGKPALIPMLDGLLAALGNPRAMPEGWPALYRALRGSEDPEVVTRALKVAQQFGDEEAAREVLARVRDQALPAAERRAALELLVQTRSPLLEGKLHGWLDDEVLGLAAIRALGVMPASDSGEKLVERFESSEDSDLRDAVLQTLASRDEFIEVLAEAIPAGRIPKEAVPVYLARQIAPRHPALKKLWGGEVRSSRERKELLRHWEQQLPEDYLASGDVESGKLAFQQFCGACHQMHGEGGDLGPDLTGSNRANLDYLLHNVLWPNDDVGEAYKLVNLTLDDGQRLSGNIVQETEDTITFKQVGETREIPVSKVASREVLDASLMPPGLFDAMSREQVRDLVVYLRETAP